MQARGIHLISTVFIVGDHNKLLPKMSMAVCACLPATPNSLTDPGGAKMQNQFQELEHQPYFQNNSAIYVILWCILPEEPLQRSLT